MARLLDPVATDGGVDALAAVAERGAASGGGGPSCAAVPVRQAHDVMDAYERLMNDTRPRRAPTHSRVDELAIGVTIGLLALPMVLAIALIGVQAFVLPYSPRVPGRWRRAGSRAMAPAPPGGRQRECRSCAARGGPRSRSAGCRRRGR